MAYILRMPRLSDTMQEGELLKWLRKEGDHLSPGDVIAEVETDKATMEFECFEGGFLKKIITKENTVLKVGSAMAVVVDNMNEDISESLKNITQEQAGKGPSFGEGKHAEPSAPHIQPPPVSHETRPGLKPRVIPQAPQPLTNDPHRWIKASPLARAIAEQKGIDLTRVVGTGPGGRILKADVEKMSGGSLPTLDLDLPKVPQEGKEIRLSMMRKAIVKTMHQSKPGIPHYYLTVDVDAEALEDLRESLKKKAKKETAKVTLTSLVVKAAAVALKKHPEINTIFNGDHLVQYPHADIGVAVDIEEGGLIAPIIRHCDEKSLQEIAENLSDLAQKARSKKLKEEDYKGATFAVSNLGMFGIRSFTTVILPPAASMLAVGVTQEIPVVREGKIVIGKQFEMTLSCDHRVIDGAVGARFLKTLKEILEEPKVHVS